MRFLIATILVILSGAACTTSQTPRKPFAPDAMCVNDCLGAGGTQDFCQSRCSD
jgi:hypothetical protein